jgi:type II secretory pathway pseudopilin PulG
MMRSMKSNRSRSRSAESGYVLLAVMLTVTLILVALAVEAPRIAQQIKREKEEELVHRGKDYATAVKRFVHKNGGRYPVSVEQLENTNHIRFLRKKYVDPMTGESEWKMVHVGEAQVNIPAPKPGGLTGSGPGPNSLGGGPPPPPQNPAGGPNNQPPPKGDSTNFGTLKTDGIGNGQTVGGGQIMGVASVNKGQAIKEFNDKDHYNEWYFVYDLRLEQSGGTGVTVAAPRGASNASGSGNASGAGGATGSGNAPGAGGTTGSGNAPGSTGSPDSGTSSNPPNPGPPPPGQPTPTPPPQVPN